MPYQLQSTPLYPHLLPHNSSFQSVQVLDSETAGRFDVRKSAFIAGSENLRFGKFFEQQPGGSHSGFRNEHDGRLYVGCFCFHTGYLFL